MRMNTFPDGRTDALVMEWLAENGISSTVVRSYLIERSPKDSTITLVCNFDDPEASAQNDSCRCPTACSHKSEAKSDRGASGVAGFPRKIKDREGSIFTREENGLSYRLDGGSRVGVYTIVEIERDYGPIEVIEQ